MHQKKNGPGWPDSPISGESRVITTRICGLDIHGVWPDWGAWNGGAVGSLVSRRIAGVATFRWPITDCFGAIMNSPVPHSVQALREVAIKMFETHRATIDSSEV